MLRAVWNGIVLAEHPARFGSRGTSISRPAR